MVVEQSLQPDHDRRVVLRSLAIRRQQVRGHVKERAAVVPHVSLNATPQSGPRRRDRLLHYEEQAVLARGLPAGDGRDEADVVGGEEIPGEVHGIVVRHRDPLMANAVPMVQLANALTTRRVESLGADSLLQTVRIQQGHEDTRLRVFSRAGRAGRSILTATPARCGNGRARVRSGATSGWKQASLVPLATPVPCTDPADAIPDAVLRSERTSVSRRAGLFRADHQVPDVLREAARVARTKRICISRAGGRCNWGFVYETVPVRSGRTRRRIPPLTCLKRPVRARRARLKPPPEGSIGSGHPRGPVPIRGTSRGSAVQEATDRRGRADVGRPR